MGDDVIVYRMIPVRWCDLIEGEWEFQSGAFDNATPEDELEAGNDMSVILGDTLVALGRAPENLPEALSWADGDEWGVAALETAFLKHQEGQEVRRSPQEEEPAHGDVRGAKGSKRRRRLKRHASWIVRPAAPHDAG